MWKLLKQIVKEDECDFTLETNDFFRPSLKQIGNSVFDIRNYYIPKEGVKIIPSNLQTSLKEVKDRLLELLDSCAFDLLRNDAVNVRTNQGGFVFISESLAPVMDIPALGLARDVRCDAFIALPEHSVLVLTLVDGDFLSKEMLEYNMSVARGVTVTLSRFLDECVHPVHGVLPVSTLNDIVSFKAHMDRLVTKSSHFVTQNSLVMNPTRYGKVLNAFWAGVAQTKSVMAGRGEIDDDNLRFLTRDQCIILVENLNSRDVQVMCGPGTGATTLMLEVARRLSRLGNTLLVCKSREEKGRLRKVYPQAVSVDDLSTLDLSSYTGIVDDANVTETNPSCSRWRFTNIQEKLTNLKMCTKAMKREVNSMQGQIEAFTNDECQTQINYLFEGMDVFRLFSVKIKHLVSQMYQTKKAVGDLSPVCDGRDLLAIWIKPQLREFIRRVKCKKDVLHSIKEFLVEDKIINGYLQTAIARKDSKVINLGKELELQLLVMTERNKERVLEGTSANLVDVDKGDESADMSEARNQSFARNSYHGKDVDSGDKDKDETRTREGRQISLQIQDVKRWPEALDESHDSRVGEPSTSKETLRDDYIASADRDTRVAETQICLEDISEQENMLHDLVQERDSQKRHLDSLYRDLPDEWLIKVHYLQRHQDVLSLYDVELPKVISEMVRPGLSRTHAVKSEISPEYDNHRIPGKRSQIVKLRQFQQGLLKASDLFGIIRNMIVDDEDHLASIQALNGPVYSVVPSSLQVVCPKLYLDAGRSNTERCHVTTDGELINSPRDTRPSQDRPDTRPHQDRPDTRPSQDRPDTRPSQDRPDTRPSQNRPDTRPSQDRPDTRPSQDRPDTRPHQDRPDTRPSQDRPDTRPSQDRPDTRPSQDRPDTRPSQDRPDRRPSQDRPDTRPSQDRPDRRPSQDRPDTRPSQDRPDTRPSLDSPDTRPSQDSPDTRPHQDKPDTRQSQDRPDRRPHQDRPDRRPSQDRRRLRRYEGTCTSAPIPLPPKHYILTRVCSTPRYWETQNRVRVVGRVWWYGLEMGVAEAGQVDSGCWVSQQRRSWCVCVMRCDIHRDSVCTTVYRETVRGECQQNTMSNTPGTQATLHYGVVLDVGRGRLSFIDLNRGVVLAKFNESFIEELYPMFGVLELSDDFTVNMKLISGEEIDITDAKKSLIRDALT